MDPFFMYSGESRQSVQSVPAVQSLFPEPRDLELDFAADAVPTASLAPAGMDSLRGYNSLFNNPDTGPSFGRRSAPMSFMGGDVLQGMGAGSLPPCWDKLPIEPEGLPPIRGFPSGTSAQLAFNQGNRPPTQGASNTGSALPEPLDLGPLDLEAAAARDPSLKSDNRDLTKHGLFNAEKIRKEREKTEKLKEKNKRAQRKFRQRQKDKQESAEKMAADLSVQLDKLRLEMDSLELQKAEVQQQLQHANLQLSSRVPVSTDEEEPTFMPAGGWTSYHPQKGMILVATTNLKLTHNKLMKLSLQDVCKLLGESCRCLVEMLREYDQNPGNSTASQRIQALINERHALMSYLAVNKPTALYQILTTKMSDPIVEKAEPPDAEFWENALRGIELSEEQLKSILDARRTYIRKMSKLLLQRDTLIQEICTLPGTVEPHEVAKLPGLHLEWLNTMEKMRQVFDVIHRSNSYFVARFCYGDCLNTEQLARVITQSWPYQMNVFVMSRVITKGLGVPNHVDMLLAERLREEIGKSPIDVYVDTFPRAESDTLRHSQKLGSEASSEVSKPDPELYSRSNMLGPPSSSHDAQEVSESQDIAETAGPM